LTEESPLRPTPGLYYSRQKVAIERYLDTFERAHPEMVVTRLRPCTVIGPHADPAQMASLTSTIVPAIWGADPPLQLLFEEDMASALYLVIRRDAPGVYNVTSDEPRTLRELVRIRGGRVIPLPYPLVVGLMALTWRTGQSVFAPEWADLSRYPLVASNEKLKSLGWVPKYTTAEALPELARRGYLLNLVLLGLAIPGFLFGLVSAIGWVLGLSPLVGALAGFGVQPFYLLAYWLGRRGRVRLAAYIPVVAVFLVMVATAMLFVLLSTVAYVAVGAAQVAGKLPSALPPTSTLVADGAALALGLTVLVIFEWLSSREMNRLLRQSQEAERRAQEYARELEESRGLLEQRVEERTRELAESSEQLRAAHEEQRRLWETMRAMSVPVIPVLNDVIVVPLVGIVDAERADLFMTALLDGLERYRARVAIIDITGVPMVDSMVANYLVQAAQATRLLGAQAILVGITPDVAEAIVDLGVSLEGLITRADLQSGVEYALATRGRLQILAICLPLNARRGEACPPPVSRGELEGGDFFSLPSVPPARFARRGEVGYLSAPEPLRGGEEGTKGF